MRRAEPTVRTHRADTDILRRMAVQTSQFRYTELNSEIRENKKRVSTAGSHTDTGASA